MKVFYIVYSFFDLFVVWVYIFNVLSILFFIFYWLMGNFCYIVNLKLFWWLWVYVMLLGDYICFLEKIVYEDLDWFILLSVR